MSEKPVYTVKKYFCKKLPHYMKRYKPYTIHVIPSKSAWEVYYQKDGYPMMYAFGIPYSEGDGLVGVFSIAEANMWDYREMFQ